MKTQYRITRNYLDRSSPLKWLVRQEGQPTSAAIACEEVTAKNVRFMDSDGTERELGCAIVAVTDEQPIMTTTVVAAVQAGAVDGDPEHNPSNVPADKIPAGFRIARKSEIDDEYHAGSLYWERSEEKFKLNTISGSRDGANHLEAQTIIVPIEGYVAPHASVKFSDSGELLPPERGEWIHSYIKQSDIPAGHRPYVKGEILVKGDPLVYNGGEKDVVNGWAGSRAERYAGFCFTTHPLPGAPVETAATPALDANGFPPPPAGHEWHNPAKLQAKDAHEGFRLAVKAEIDGRYDGSAIYYNGHEVESYDPGYSLENDGDTWLLPVSRPFPEVVKPAAAGELTKLEYKERGCGTKGFYKPDGERVMSVQELHLKADGGVFGIL